MSDAGVKLVLLHFVISLIGVPSIVVHSVYGSHRAGPMPPPMAMDEYRLVGRIVDQLHELSHRAVRWTRMIRHRNPVESHTGIPDLVGFIFYAVRLEIDNRLDAHRRKIFIVVPAGLGSAVKSIIYAAKVAYMNSRAVSRRALSYSYRRQGAQDCHHGTPC